MLTDAHFIFLGLNELKPSSSIEAVNLDSWPESKESTPDQNISRPGTLKTFGLKNGSSESSLDFEEEFDIPIKRKGLLPPIHLEPNLPGGINLISSPEVPRRKITI